MIEITREQANALIDVIKMHENARDFTGAGYSDREWDAITDLIVKVGRV